MGISCVCVCTLVCVSFCASVCLPPSPRLSLSVSAWPSLSLSLTLSSVLPCNLYEPGTHFIIQVGLELSTILPVSWALGLQAWAIITPGTLHPKINLLPLCNFWDLESPGKHNFCKRNMVLVPARVLLIEGAGQNLPGDRTPERKLPSPYLPGRGLTLSCLVGGPAGPWSSLLHPASPRQKVALRLFSVPPGTSPSFFRPISWPWLFA